MFSMIASTVAPIRGTATSVGTFSRKRLLALLICVVWLALIACGYLALLLYEQMPGPQSIVSRSWPSSVDIKPFRGKYTLVMAIHPHCPCTSASLNELAILMTRCPRMSAYVLMFRPSDFPRNWEKTDYWYRAQAIPGVVVLTDEEGQKAKRFGVSTSGEITLYDPNGKQTFTGGITSARGHEGDNQGIDAVEAIISGSKLVSCIRTPVFGCSLLDAGPIKNGNSQDE